MLLKFEIKNQLIRCTNYNTIVADSVNFISASFSFDEEWNKYVKTITFKNLTTGINKDILIDTDSNTCFIPWEVISDEGMMDVYAEGAYSESIATTASMKYPINIIKSGKSEDGTCPTPDVYQQIMDRLSNIQIGMVSPESIYEAIEKYFLENPLDVLTKDNAEEYTPIGDYNPSTKKYVDDTVNDVNLITKIIINEENHLIITLHTGIEIDAGLMPVGESGVDGLPGEDGVTPHIDETTKHWFINDIDTGVLAEGKNGKNGADGQDGAPGTPGTDGIDGVTPHIDIETKHWMIGGSDTGVLAEGKNGQNGTDGTPGRDGQNGEDGADGVGVEIGSIIIHTGNDAPSNFLLCNGATYNISDYSLLSQHFASVYESVNNFGGDGVTTFAVPDLSEKALVSGVIYCIRYQ